MPPKRTRAAAGASKPPAAKRGKAVSAGASRAAIIADPVPSSTSASATVVDQEQLRERFIALFSDSEEVSNRALKEKFGEEYLHLVPIINDLTQKARLVMGKKGDELYYTLVSDETAAKWAGLDLTARMVYQVIEKAGNLGIWTKDIRTQTNIQQQALNKIFKVLEGRLLIKPVKSVNAKAKKLYMLYNLTPAKELTGGPWYTELEFDHEFISELRTFLMHCVRKLNNGQGVTLSELKEKMVQANVSRVQLSLEEVQQLMQTLAYDRLVESSSENEHGEAIFVAARRVTPMCEFKWWDVLSPDFQFLEIKFEDGVTLSAHEPHHHTA
jgi:DNA-directed RNA polymerase III subunit RPC6